MARKSTQQPAPSAETPVPHRPARCVEIAQSGIRTSRDFAAMMSAMMADLCDGAISPSIGNAMCNAGGKLLKVVEMEYRYGPSKTEKDRVLRLTGD